MQEDLLFIQNNNYLISYALIYKKLLNNIIKRPLNNIIYYFVQAKMLKVIF